MTSLGQPQRSFTPRHVGVQWVTPAQLGASCKSVALGVDDQEYAVKALVPFPTVPANEWICHALANECGLVTPEAVVLEMSDGPVFGSRWEGGVIADQTERLRVLTGANPGASVISRPVSRILTFDYFVWNTDRHVDNYMIRASRAGPVVHAMDFSHALFFRMWPAPLGRMPQCHTMRTWARIKQHVPFSNQVAHETLNALAKIPADYVKRLLDQMPGPWLDDKMRDAFVAWWEGDGRSERIEFIRSGVDDGSLI